MRGWASGSGRSSPGGHDAHGVKGGKAAPQPAPPALPPPDAPPPAAPGRGMAKEPFPLVPLPGHAVLPGAVQRPPFPQQPAPPPHAASSSVYSSASSSGWSTKNAPSAPPPAQPPLPHPVSPMDVAVVPQTHFPGAPRGAPPPPQSQGVTQTYRHDPYGERSSSPQQPLARPAPPGSQPPPNATTMASTCSSPVSLEGVVPAPRYAPAPNVAHASSSSSCSPRQDAAPVAGGDVGDTSASDSDAMEGGTPAPEENAQERSPMSIMINKKTDEPLGVSFSRRRGLTVNNIHPNSPAMACGLAKCKGWLLTQVDDQPVRRVKDFAARTAGKASFKLTLTPRSNTLRASKDKHADPPRVPPAPPVPEELESMVEAVQMPTVAQLVFKCGRVGEFGTVEDVVTIDKWKGEHWLVEAAKGMDLGEMRAGRPNDDPNARPQYRLYRRASDQEVEFWRGKLTQEEDVALVFVREAARRLRTKVVVHATEFQFDKMKLTIHYSSEKEKPDFRQLLHETFKEYQIRIWMNNCRPKEGQPGEPLDMDCLPPPPPATDDDTTPTQTSEEEEE